MYQIRPDDYAAFRCLAGACPQTCCAAWEIVVDPDAQDAYTKSMLLAPAGQSTAISPSSTCRMSVFSPLT